MNKNQNQKPSRGLLLQITILLLIFEFTKAAGVIAVLVLFDVVAVSALTFGNVGLMFLVILSAKLAIMVYKSNRQNQQNQG